MEVASGELTGLYYELCHKIYGSSAEIFQVV